MKSIKVILAAFIIFIGASCTKDSNEDSDYFTPNSNRSFTEAEMELATDRAKALANEITEIRIFDEKSNRVIHLDPVHKEFSFSTPNEGWNFSSNQDVTFVPYSGGGGVLYIGADAIGGNSGGVLVAGNNVLNVNYTFCFSASEEALGLDFFDFGGQFNGISSVIGIAGQLDNLEDFDEEDDFTDFFQGFAVYVVYDNEASGNYDVFDWLGEIDSEDNENSEAAFGYMVDFVNPGIFFTIDGTLTVTGGQIGFDGQYFALLDFFLEFLDEDSDPEVVIVDGYGEMGC